VSEEWPTAAEWLASGTEGGIVVAGMPLKKNAVTPSDYDLAPAAIRARLARLSSFHGERGIDLRAVPVVDRGNSGVAPQLDAPLTVVLGGHNAVTFHVLSSAPNLRESWGLLTLDAHHDVRAYRPGAVGNGSPVRALVDAGLRARNVVQVGIHGFSNAAGDRQWCVDRKVTVVSPDGVGRVPELLDELASRCEKIYVDIDVDVLDRAFAPGCPGARPGGVLPRDLFAAAFACGAHPSVKAVDIVEVNPTADVANVTVDAAALAFLNVAAGFASRTEISAAG
jgi:formiminoglutamase